MPVAIVLQKDSSTPDYHALRLKEIPAPVPKQGEVLVEINAAALNHRDLYQRQSLYPAISFSAPILADGVGTVVNSAGGFAAGSRVLINPGTGWDSDPDRPEGLYTALGGTALTPLGTLTSALALPAADIAHCPPHLTMAEAAALPLAGLTAWRAVMSKTTAAQAGKNIFVTGIGGGVALFALQFAAAAGANVFVSSSSAEKLDRAKALGAVAGVNYREEGWVKKLKGMLPKDRPFLDAVIDGAGGDIVGKLVGLLGTGAVVVSYGITTLEPPVFPMKAVMKNVELKGTAMGSMREFRDMLRFVEEKRIRPVVSKVAKGGIRDVEGIDELFSEMDRGGQFGKLVVLIQKEEGSKL